MNAFKFNVSLLLAVAFVAEVMSVTITQHRMTWEDIFKDASIQKHSNNRKMRSQIHSKSFALSHPYEPEDSHYSLQNIDTHYYAQDYGKDYSQDSAHQQDYKYVGLKDATLAAFGLDKPKGSPFKAPPVSLVYSEAPKTIQTTYEFVPEYKFIPVPEKVHAESESFVSGASSHGGHHHYPHHHHHGDQDEGYASNYKFGYRVSDPHTGADFGHSEVAEGGVKKGQYHVLLPDGRLQNVKYWADPSGYHATVTYEGRAYHYPTHH